jgi:hypothetical protein
LVFSIKAIFFSRRQPFELFFAANPRLNVGDTEQS